MSMALSLATRGVICVGRTAIITEFVPDARPTVLAPDVLAEGKTAPKVQIDSATDPNPKDVSIQDTLAPQLNVAHIAPPVPDARPKQPSDEPSVNIRPVVDLKPTIVDKD